MQKPDATRVAGFKAWLALGYCVRRGEKALRIFAPCPPSKAKLQAWRDAGADPAEKPRTFFRLTAVFDTLSRDRGRRSNAGRRDSLSDAPSADEKVAAARVRSPEGATSPCRRACRLGAIDEDAWLGSIGSSVTERVLARVLSAALA